MKTATESLHLTGFEEILEDQGTDGFPSRLQPFDRPLPANDGCLLCRGRA